MDIDDDEDINLQTFRHFTRDDLAEIHQLIFENKLAAKKKAEKLAKNKAVSTTNNTSRKSNKNLTINF